MTHDAYQSYLEERKQTSDRSNARYLSCIGGSISYGSLAVRSSFLLNGGILFALPAYFASLRGISSSIEVNALLAPASCFVFGIFLASVACLCGYLNFQWQAFSTEWERVSDLDKLEEKYETSLGIVAQFNHESYRGQLLKDMRKFDRNILVSSWVGPISGVGSLVAFCAGCVVAASELLAPSG